MRNARDVGASGASSVRGVAINTWGYLIPPLLALAGQPVLARVLGASGRGVVAAATSPVMFAALILTLGLPDALNHFVASGTSNSNSLRKRAAWSLSLIGLIGTLFLVFFSSLLSGGDESVQHLLQIAAIALIPTLLSALGRGVSSGHLEWGRMAAQRILGSVFQTAAILLLWAVGLLTETTAVCAVAASLFVGGVVFLVRKNALPNGQGSPASFRLVCGYGSRIWLGTLAGVSLSRLDQVLLTPLNGVYQLGLYAVAVNVSEVILVFNYAARDVLFSVESSSPDMRRLTMASRLSTLVTSVCGLFVYVFAPSVIPFLFGHDFVDSLPTVYVLLFAIILGNPGSIAGAGLSARGRPGLRSLSLAIAALVNVILMLLLVPRYGSLGAAIATLGGNLVSGNLNILWLRVYFGVPMFSFYAFRVQDVHILISKLSSLIPGHR